MWMHDRIDSHFHLPAFTLTDLVHHPHLSRLGMGLLALGAADLTHHLWGADTDPLLLALGGAGALWAIFAKRITATLAGIVLFAVGFFAVLDDHAAFTRAEDTLVLLILAGLILLVPGLPMTWRTPWPLVPAGALVLVTLFALLRLVAVWAAAPWSVGASILVAVLGGALLLWDMHGGHVP
ncbi:MAG TPA: hypothetical protein VNL35_07280 [Chloroflexota bacterium]|nr:hypothetical protein [Chloroflexota bacterium]